MPRLGKQRGTGGIRRRRGESAAEKQGEEGRRDKARGHGKERREGERGERGAGHSLAEQRVTRMSWLTHPMACDGSPPVAFFSESLIRVTHRSNHPLLPLSAALTVVACPSRVSESRIRVAYPSRLSGSLGSFLQYWNRYEGELAHRWGVADLETRERAHTHTHTHTHTNTHHNETRDL